KIAHGDALDDHCGEARWRLAWMSFKENDWAKAKPRLEELAQEDEACGLGTYDRTRAYYWLGQIALQESNHALARQHWQNIFNIDPLGFYAQQAWQRLKELGDKASLAALPKLNI